MIRDACDVRALKLLRLVSHAFHDLVTPTIFRDVWLGLFNYSLKTLQNIAQSTKLAPLVKQLIVCGSWMRPLSMVQWKAYVDVPALRHFESTKRWCRQDMHPRDFPWLKKTEKRRCGNLTEEELRNHYKKYRDLAQQQRKWLRSCKVRQSLRRCVKSLLDLQYINIPSAQASNCNLTPEPLWLNLWSDTLVLNTWWPNAHGQDNVAATLCVLECYEMLKSRACAPKLSISLTDVPRLQEWFAKKNLQQSWRLAPIREPLRHVKDLELKIDYNEIEEKARLKAGAVGFADWLRSAEQVTRLELRIREDLTYLMRHLWRYNHKFPNLKQLVIAVPCHEMVLLQFLGRQSHSLESLVIGTSETFEGSWASFLTKLPSYLPNLKSFKIEGLLHEEERDLPRRCDFNWMLRQPTWFAEYTAYLQKGGTRPTMDPLQWFDEHDDELADDPWGELLDHINEPDREEAGGVQQHASLTTSGGDPSALTSTDPSITNPRSPDVGNVPADESLPMTVFEDPDIFASEYNIADEAPSDCTTNPEDWASD